MGDGGCCPVSHLHFGSVYIHHCAAPLCTPRAREMARAPGSAAGGGAGCVRAAKSALLGVLFWVAGPPRTPHHSGVAAVLFCVCVCVCGCAVLAVLENRPPPPPCTPPSPAGFLGAGGRTIKVNE